MMQVDMTQYIPRGYRNGVSREELRRRTKLSDRKIRECIEWTSENVETVFSYSGRYFFYSCDEDRPYCKHYFYQEKIRANTLNRKIRIMRAMWKSGTVTGQIEDDIGG